MSAYKEFANFVTLNMASLTAIYAQILANRKVGYENFSTYQREASARILLQAVIDSFTSQTSKPLFQLFDGYTAASRRRWTMGVVPPRPLAEIECLGQTLTPVVINLDAGKFLWEILSEIRAAAMPISGLNGSKKITEQGLKPVSVNLPGVESVPLKQADVYEHYNLRTKIGDNRPHPRPQTTLQKQVKKLSAINWYELKEQYSVFRIFNLQFLMIGLLILGVAGTIGWAVGSFQ